MSGLCCDDKDMATMFFQNAIRARKTMLLGGVLVGAILVSLVRAQSPTAAGTTASQPNFRYQPNRLPKRAGMYYQGVWGVDALKVKAVESGEIIRFAWHVLDADKAKPLHDKKLEPWLIDPQAGVKLVVPSLENVGTLRQSGTPETGKSYWMAFSNPGRRVKPGDHVDVVIGHFRAEGLVVE